MILPLATRQRLSAGDVHIRLPGTRIVDGLMIRDGVLPPGYAPPRGYREYGRELERDIRFYAPRWIAWLYRWLPTWISWRRGATFDTAPPPAYFLWHVMATRWSLAWLPKRRASGYRPRWFGVLCLNDWRLRL